MVLITAAIIRQLDDSFVTDTFYLKLHLALCKNHPETTNQFLGILSNINVLLSRVGYES